MRYIVRFDENSCGYFIHDTGKKTPYTVDDNGLAINWYPNKKTAEKVAAGYNRVHVLMGGN